MLVPGERVLAAVSGGADSVALLHVLLQLGYRVEVAHLDHGTRDGESALDAAHVAALADSLGLPCHATRRAVAAEAAQSRTSFESYARKVRYEFLVDTARRLGIAVVSTGHQADDQAETVLLRLLRGCGPEGIAGIPPVRTGEGVRIVRPLLDCTRDQIVAWLTELGVSWREDRSNQDTAHERNRVRHELLPMLARDFNPRIRDALMRLADAQREEMAYLDAETDACFRQCLQGDGALDRARFCALPTALQRRCLRRYAWSLGVRLDFAQTVAGTEFVACGATGQYFDIGVGVVLYNGRDATRAVSIGTPSADATPCTVLVPGRTQAMGHCFFTRLLGVAEIGDPRVYCSSGRQVFDADAVGVRLTVRPRHPGDTIVPFGMKGRKKIKDVMIAQGIPAPARDSVPLLCAADGEVLWIVGHRVSERGRVDERTLRVLEVRVEKAGT